MTLTSRGSYVLTWMESGAIDERVFRAVEGPGCWPGRAPGCQTGWRVCHRPGLWGRDYYSGMPSQPRYLRGPRAHVGKYPSPPHTDLTSRASLHTRRSYVDKLELYGQTNGLADGQTNRLPRAPVGAKNTERSCLYNHEDNCSVILIGN